MPTHDAQLSGVPKIALVKASSIEEARLDAAKLLDVPASELVLTVLEHQHRCTGEFVGSDKALDTCSQRGGDGGHVISL